MVVYVSSVFSVFIALDMNVSVSWCWYFSCVCGQCVCEGEQREADSICACMNNFSHSDDSKCQHNILLGEGKTVGRGRPYCVPANPRVLVSNYLLVCVC